MLPEKEVPVGYDLLEMDPYSQRNANPPGTLPARENGATGGKINMEHGAATTIGCCKSVSDLGFFFSYSTFIR